MHAASATVDLLLQLAPGPQIAARLADVGETLHAPQLLVVEVAQVLRRWERRSDLAAKRASFALGDLGDLGVVYYDHEDLVPRIWSLRANLSAYAAAYVALAEALDAPLLTTDARLAGVPGVSAVVELVVGS